MKKIIIGILVSFVVCLAINAYAIVARYGNNEQTDGQSVQTTQQTTKQTETSKQKQPMTRTDTNEKASPSQQKKK